MDNCGNCVEGSTGLTACLEDCRGVAGGTAIKDCSGTCEGSAQLDACGICSGGDTGTEACVADCNQDLGGTAFIDNCGECVAGHTNKLPCSQDCAGLWGGMIEPDLCGVCDPWVENDNLTCEMDCAGEWNGAAQVDACGVCETEPEYGCEAVCATASCNGGVCKPLNNTVYECTCFIPWGGAVCTSCASGFYGEGCAQQCPGGAWSPCNENGVCDDGLMGSGVCECKSGWEGVECSQEAPLVIERITAEGNQFNSLAPRVAIGGNGVAYLVWQQCSTGDPCDKSTVMVSRHLGAAGWASAVEVSPLSIRSAHGTQPDIAVDSGGRAHIIWHDTGTVGARISDTDILYRTWDGTNVAGLGSVTTVSVGSELACGSAGNCQEVYESRIALLSDSPRVVFRGDGTSRAFETYYATLSGTGWYSTQVSNGSLDSPSGSGDGAISPGIAIDPIGGVHLIWRNKQSQVQSSLHYHLVGGSGEPMEVPRVCESGVVAYPSLAVDGAGKVHVAWTGNRDCNDSSLGFSVYYSVKDGATGFGTPVEITGESSLAGASHEAPQIVIGAAAGQNQQPVGVTWSSNAAVGQSGGDSDILFQRYGEEDSQPALRLLSEPTSADNISNASSVFPSTASDAAGILACWQEKDDSPSPDFDIFCTRLEW